MNNTNHIADEDLALFALQLLPEHDAADARLHLESCDVCRDEVGRFQGDLAAYALAVEMNTPPAVARERLMRRIAKERKVVPLDRVAPLAEATEPMLNARTNRVLEIDKAPRRRGAIAMAWIGWAVAAGMAVAAGLQFHQRQLLQGELSSESAKLTQTNSGAARAQDALQTLTDAGALQVALHLPTTGTAPPPPEGRAAYLADKGSLVFVANHLQPLQPNKTYELWVVPQDGRGPIPAGTFKPDVRGNASVVMPDLPRGVAAKAIAVTIEAEGGSSTPTKPIILVGM